MVSHRATNTLQLSGRHADFFNLFNKANFGFPRAPQQEVLNPSTGNYIAGAGKITRTVTAARQIQFGLKLVF